MQPHHIKFLKWGTAAYLTTATAAFLYVRSSRSPTANLSDAAQVHIVAQDPTRRSAVFDLIAGSYDRDIDLDEFVMGIKLMRKRLLRHANGHTLEISAGTGRNLPYYRYSTKLHESDNSGSSKNATNVIFSDKSVPMLTVLADKLKLHSLEACQPIEASNKRNFAKPISSQTPLSTGETSNDISTRTASILSRHHCLQAIDSEGRQVSLVQAAAESLPFETDSFDTVIDTFGLCSVIDPAKALQEMQRVCKPNGKILLLEHGRSGYSTFLNSKLDKSAESHAARWGCWWNRDIKKLLESSDLGIEFISSWHFGTTMYAILRKASTNHPTR